MKKKLIVLLGLPRSGTTMSTAVFDVHPKIVAWFEPWHTRQALNPEPLNSIDDFVFQYKKFFNIDATDKNIYMFKETTTNMPAIEWTGQSIKNIIKSDNVDVKIIWLIRDINHAYLSRVHTAREHWGHPDMKIDVDSFKNYVDFAYRGFKAIENVVNQYDSCLLSYEKLVSDTENTLKNVMNFVGIELHPNQLEYHKHFKKHKSAGDPEVSTNPRPVTVDKVINKDREWEEYKDLFLNSLTDKELEKYNNMNKIVCEIRDLGYKEIDTNLTK